MCGGWEVTFGSVYAVATSIAVPIAISVVVVALMIFAVVSVILAIFHGVEREVIYNHASNIRMDFLQ
jgi:hypothetical protein